MLLEDISASGVLTFLSLIWLKTSLEQDRKLAVDKNIRRYLYTFFKVPYTLFVN